ncbi:hypothetical protein CONPUDRAFT_157505 [Coniophora puteana RWD-64-598 SS2]|uniref:Uncharacterized protein n=1 Tax=Coniophora puteana (strain RWD-64-598) TaxID=741705 RepID=A0A5M3MF76_CONPW|nr:uncharacterized protein CONPUDRAFT_157505 [Coniophora puteana RWD-64-598 SS2]EIW77241.1 hypothetical protein CONPUDRAFT_157505 [Coniophora puteana RWD-64-598 SS2]
MADVKVYTVNGDTTGSASSIPDWLTQKTSRPSTSSSSKPKRGKKSRRVDREAVEGKLELIQGFEFPAAAVRLKTTRAGHHVVATGAYKPQVRVWDLDELGMKFERHCEAENVDFEILSDDWTKLLLLQNDRTVELHAQGGLHHRTRIPRFGRAVAYHASSADALFATSGSEIYRLNLAQGRFLAPFSLSPSPSSSPPNSNSAPNAPPNDDDDLEGVDALSVNPAHGLIAAGARTLSGAPVVSFVDPRARAPVGRLAIASGAAATRDAWDGVTALAARHDGLSYALGTGSGHVLVYDVRMARAQARKDQGYGLPIRRVEWIDKQGPGADGEALVMSADRKVVKVWERGNLLIAFAFLVMRCLSGSAFTSTSASAYMQPAKNLFSITPGTDLNDITHVRGSGLLLTAHEGPGMGAFYVPALGPAPRWARFLENITEEMEGAGARSVYEDYKFVERSELKTLGLEHLVGTPALKPYMHGYFLALELYDTARLIANPFVYAEHREKLVRQRMDKLAESRIRAPKAGSAAAAAAGVKVNKALAEKITRDAEREQKKREKERERARRRREREEGEKEKMNVDGEEKEDQSGSEDEEGGEPDEEEEEEEEEEEKEGEETRPTLLSDPRFKALFENPAFTVDEESREYALLNPSQAAQRRSGAGAATNVDSRGAKGRTRTAVESEESEVEGLGDLTESSNSDEEKASDGDASDDSSDAGDLMSFNPRARAPVDRSSNQQTGIQNQGSAFAPYARSGQSKARAGPAQRTPRVDMVPLVASTEANGRGGRGGDRTDTFGARRTGKSYAQQNGKGKGRARPDADGWGGGGREMETSWVPSASGADGDGLYDDGPGGKNKGGRKPGARKGVEFMGASMERGGGEDEDGDKGRGGRTQRRKGMRSGSRNVFRKLG